LVSCMRSSAYGPGEMVHEEVPVGRRVEVEPGDARVAPEPGPLAAGEAGRAPDGPGGGGLKGDAPGAVPAPPVANTLEMFVFPAQRPIRVKVTVTIEGKSVG